MTEKCQQCKDWAFREATGSFPSGQAFNRWAMWGCTCDGTSVPETVAFFQRVTQ